MGSELRSNVRLEALVVFVAAVAAAAAVVFRLGLPILDGRSPAERLIAALRLPYRASEARLTEDSIYRRAWTSGARAPQFVIRAGMLGALRRDGSVVDNQRAIAVANLLEGDARRAVNAATVAIAAETGSSDLANAIARSRNAAVLNDLAAALWKRGRDRENPADFVIAFEAAERSWRLRRSPASAWNRALSLEALHLDADAFAKWSEYLAVETDEEWIAEAREHLRRLETRPTDRCAKIGDLVARGDERAIAGCSDRARIFGEEVLLARWSAAVRAQADADATRSLTAARTLGAFLANTNGDHLLQDAVRAIDAGGLPMADAHALYAEGRAAYTKQDMTAAVEKLAAAEAELASHGSALAARACMYGAMAQYFMGQPSAARTQLTRCGRERFDSPALSAEIAQNHGLIDAASGATVDAMASYRAALAMFDRGHEVDSIAALHGQIAILDMLMGEQRDAWRHRALALALNAQRPLSSRRAQILLLDVARAASAEGCPLAALTIQTRILELAREGRQPDFLVNALQYRVRYLADAGLADLARRDLAEAESTLPLIKEAAIRERSAANVKQTRVYLTRTSDPAAAVTLLETTIDDLRRVDSRPLLPDLYVELARSNAQLGRYSAAEQAIANAAAEIEFLNAHVGFSGRRAHLDSQRRVREAGLEILAQEHAYERALEFADRFDGQLCNGARLTDLPLPADAAVVKYAVLADRLFIWVIREGRVTPFLAEVSTRTLQSSLDAIEEDCSGKDAGGCRTALATLYEHLIAPARDVLPARLVIVPDDFLAAVPFAALFDEQSKRHLVEDHAIVISRAPSCSGVRTLFSDVAVDDAKDVVVVGNPWPIDPPLDALPFAEIEARGVARRYRGSTLLVSADATKQRVVSELQRAELIHYAGHGDANLDDPDLSALYLAATDGDRGLLTAREIAAMDLHRARLVVLSACRSNAGRFSAQGALSLANAFIRAGAQTVVATLWDTNDDDSERLLAAFHASLQRGLSAAEALRAAQIEMLRNGEGFKSALTWAAYQVVD